MLLLFTYGEEDEPEPEKDVELLVDNVQGQDAQSVRLEHPQGSKQWRKTDSNRLKTKETHIET